MPAFSEIWEDFLRIGPEIARATVATVDTEGRPPRRVMVLTAEAAVPGGRYKSYRREGDSALTSGRR